YVTSRFPSVDVSSVKQVLAYKCKENSTALKMKSIRYICFDFIRLKHVAAAADKDFSITAGGASLLIYNFLLNICITAAVAAANISRARNLAFPATTIDDHTVVVFKSHVIYLPSKDNHLLTFFVSNMKRQVATDLFFVIARDRGCHRAGYGSYIPFAASNSCILFDCERSSNVIIVKSHLHARPIRNHFDTCMCVCEANEQQSDVTTDRKIMSMRKERVTKERKNSRARDREALQLKNSSVLQIGRVFGFFKMTLTVTRGKFNETYGVRFSRHTDLWVRATLTNLKNKARSASSPRLRRISQFHTRSRAFRGKILKYPGDYARFSVCARRQRSAGAAAATSAAAAAAGQSSTGVSMLHVGHLRHRVIHRVTVVVLRLLRHRQPSIQELPAAEQLVEGRAELPAHRAVQDEINRRVHQRQDVHSFACNVKIIKKQPVHVIAIVCIANFNSKAQASRNSLFAANARSYSREPYEASKQEGGVRKHADIPFPLKRIYPARERNDCVYRFYMYMCYTTGERSQRKSKRVE
ncbi:unnamed protein product, partial [Trichogramma brassicae]